MSDETLTIEERVARLERMMAAVDQRFAEEGYGTPLEGDGVAEPVNDTGAAYSVGTE